MDYALALNTRMFGKVYVLCEGACAFGRNVEFRTKDGRQTYADLIEWAGQVCASDNVCVISNCDIVFPDIELLADSVRSDSAFCLSRWEVLLRGGLKHWDEEWSQDSWAFLGPPRVSGGDYFFGVPGCDNKFAYELDAAGYRLQNPSKSIVTIHLHASGRRTETNHRRNRVPPPYLLVKPHSLEDQFVSIRPHAPHEEALLR